jgi:ribosomal protein S18 acetylase RimI-like enzyme
VIRPGTAGDARRAAELHASGITEGFLSRLGPRFLERLYRCVVRDEGSFLLVSEEGGIVNGMIAGSENVPALYKRFLRREGLAAAVVAAPRLVRNAGSVLETLRYSGSNDDELPSAELLSVAVDRTARGQGFGRRLVEALKEEFTRRGTSTSKVVVGADNEPALKLYRECGYRDAASVQVHRDVNSQVLVWSSPAR